MPCLRPSDTLPPMRRRQFLTLSAATIGGVLVYSLDRKTSLLSAQHKPVRIPLRFFTETEALTVAAAASRIFPSDGTGPGAREAGVAIFIDRQLAGSYGRDRFRYTQPPFEDAAREFGYQGSATPRQIYRDGLKDLHGFHLLAPEKQDEAFRRIESTLFFSLLRQNTIEGMFWRSREKKSVDTLLLSASPKHHRGHVLRSNPWGKRRHGRLATCWLPR